MRVIPPIWERFWAKVKRAGADECWPWIGAKSSDGYGSVKDDKKTHGAHRLAWMLTNGPIPPGMEVCHKCDYPACCNVAHMFLGNREDNMRDMAAKGRGKSRIVPGEGHPDAKLSDCIVRLLRRSSASSAFLARLFGVTPSVICHARSGRTWAHVQ